MPDRLKSYLRTQIPTYRVALSDLSATATGVAQIAFELLGVANKQVKLRHLQLSKPSLVIEPFQINKYSVASTGSADQSIVSPVPFRGTDSTYGGIMRLYTALPSSTAGTLVDQMQEIDILTTDVMNESFGDLGGINAPTLEGSTESFGFVITSTAANILNGYLEFTEEP